MNTKFSFIFLSWILIIFSIAANATPLKPRLVVLTDISTWEPDDHESLIRLMVHADLYEIEGIVITTGLEYGQCEST